MAETYGGFEKIDLGEGSHFFVGTLPEELRPDAAGFEGLWALHPDDHHTVQMFGRPVLTPRWQQAYGVDYRYSGRTNSALAVPQILKPIRDWARRTIDGRLNGLLLNWYDGRLGHYIGPHHDSVRDMVAGAPIVTISLGEERVFRLSRPKADGSRDFPAPDGTVFIMPYETNLAWKHAVPRSARYRGRRISFTLRAFESPDPTDERGSARPGNSRRDGQG
ncbi:alpha-ketoglutarate-dependent dioxygenase AlkB [Aquisphaera insulae]|uniref:alpha-ketoglutarate-dependent dioxygenase AlkB n=1 Tax=Aquisphaera insulae TaxID=2712864 RepID=UPI0013EE23D7|nr:alpha-ketoglutarate-dependent dioxygenase AlkB [Aquisphaera insulae]